MSEIDPSFISKSVAFSKSARIANKIHNIEQAHPGAFEAPILVVGLTNEQQEVTEIEVAVKESGLITDGIVGDDYPYEQNNETTTKNISYISKHYFGDQVYTDAYEAYLKFSPEETNDEAIKRYTDATIALQAIRHYITLKERVAYAAYLDVDNPTNRSSTMYGPLVAESLEGSPYAPKAHKPSLMKRLVSRKAPLGPQRDIMDLVKLELNSDEMLTLTNQITRARAWHDVHAADAANMMALDTINDLASYYANILPENTREYNKLVLLARNTAYGEISKKRTDGTYDVNHVDRGLLDFSTALREVVNLKTLPDKLGDQVVLLRKIQLGAIATRSAEITPLPGGGVPGKLRYTPTNAGLFIPKTPQREVIEVAPAPTIDPEILAQRRIEERAARLQARQDLQLSQQNELLAANERDAPKLASLNSLVDEYDEAMKPFRAKSGKQLRAVGISGSDSLEFFIRRNAGNTLDLGNLNERLRTYDGLTTFTTRHSHNDIDIVSKLLEQLDELASIHDTTLAQTQLEGNQKPKPLSHIIHEDIDWLRDNWQLIETSAKQSSHRQYIDETTLERIGMLLDALKDHPTEEAHEVELEAEVEMVESPSEIIEPTPEPTPELAPLEDATPLPEQPTEIERLNAMAEQLDWVILPNDLVTAEDIISVARKQASGNKTYEIDRERVEMLLYFRDQYGGELYKSAERTLGDSDNLYFVLKFTREEDHKVYAIAENVVFGNATYVIREDVMPLEPGETVLTSVTLSRKDIRDLGAKRVIHMANATKTHHEKIVDSINTLSRQPSL
jgi:hypothetical protein